MSTNSDLDEPINITLIGAGTIGLSFAALHLTQNPLAQITIFDTRPDLDVYISSHLPDYLSTSPNAPTNIAEHTARLKTAPSLELAVRTAHIVQEQGPENPLWKQATWAAIERSASPTALFWSSTSGIPASTQATHMTDPSRLLVVHPYNPPHIMPLLEIVPSPTSSFDVVSATVAYWKALGRSPVVVKKECAGFVANRLALALFREAISLVNEGVIGVRELDEVVTSSMGPRWAVQGPFKSYHAGGGEGGLRSLFANIGGTMRDCWVAGEEVKVGPGGKEGWEEGICQETEKTYGRIDTGETGRKTRAVLEAVRGHVEGMEVKKSVEEIEQEDR